MESALRDQAQSDLRVFETMLWTPDQGVHRLDLHLARLKRGCEQVGFRAGNIDGILSVIKRDGPQRIRLSVGSENDVQIETWDFVPLAPDVVWAVSFAQEQVRSDDPWLQIKTTKRALYNKLRADLVAGVDEVIVLNERQEVCEGTITNIFVDLGEGLVTPPLSSGLLPGILRQELLATGKAREQVLLAGDLIGAKSIYVGNSLRGLIKARLL